MSDAFHPVTVSAGLGCKTINSPLGALAFLDEWTGRRGCAFEAARRACLEALGDKTRGAKAADALLAWAKAASIDLPTLNAPSSEALPARPGIGWVSA
jgi:hypothetical protein